MSGLFSVFYLRDAVARLKKVIQTIEDTEDEEELEIDILKNTTVNAWADLMAGTTELIEMYDSSLPSSIMAVKAIAEVSAGSLITAKDADGIYNAIKPAINAMNMDEDALNILTVTNYDRDKKNAYSCLGISDEAMKLLIDAIKADKNKALYVLDVNAGRGDALMSFNGKYDGNKKLFGTFLYSYDVSNEVRENCERVAIGLPKDVHIQHETFDVVLCTPPIALTNLYNNPLKKSEKDMLIRSMDYLNKDGIIMITMPLTSMRTDMCTYMSKNLKDIEIRCEGNLIHVIGKKNTEKGREPNPKTLSALKLMILRNEEQRKKFSMENALQEYRVACNELEIKTFRGGELDDAEMERIFATSSAQKEYEKKSSISKIMDKARRPLLPFSLGQIGLILTSGCLDGIVTDKDGHAHVVKGRVIKQSEEQEIVDENSDKIIVRTTEANRVQIEVITPDGTYKKLA